MQAREYQSDEEPFEDLFCPYCGLAKEKNKFLSPDVIGQAQAIAYNHMVEELKKSFKKMQRSVRHSNGLIKLDFKPLKKVTIRELKGKDTVETEFTCSCCGRKVKALYCAGVAKIFCPYCGVDI